MNTFEKMLNVIKENAIYAIAMVAALILFFYFSNGLIPGLITVIAAFIIYICGDKMYKEYKILDAKKAIKLVVKPEVKTAAKPVAKKTTSPVAKPAVKKTAVKKKK